MGRAPSEDEIRTWFEKYSNWGRWGDEDRLGTLNLITPEKRRQAAQTVQSGEAVSCAWDTVMNSSPVPSPPPPQRFMYRTGLGYLSNEDPDSPAGPRSSDGSMGTASEFMSMVFHGRAITHLDALSHVFWQGRMYNDLPSSWVTDRDGATVHDVREAGAGIQSRGVLLDIARLRGVDALEPTDAIYPEDLEAAEEAQGVRVESGDILVVRTGDGTRRLNGTWDPDGVGTPGLQAACIPWLHEREVAALASDVPQDVVPSGYPNIYLPVHSVGIVAMGLWLIDNCQVEDLGAACERHQRWAFQLTIAPLRLDGVTGSPVNPIALF